MASGKSNWETTRQRAMSLSHSHAANNGSPLAWLVVLQGPRLGQRVEIDSLPLLIGRSDECNFRIIENSVSRHHACIWREPSGYRIQDLGSTNRTLVNNQPIDEVLLKDGDHITIGSCVLKFMEQSSVETRYHEALYQLAAKDSLTGLSNRRQFMESFELELAHALGHDRPLALLIIDLDHFKSVNDCHGHLAGDTVLRHIATLLQTHAREEFAVGRIGGEEFAVVLPKHETHQAGLFAETLRTAIAANRIEAIGMACVTVSIGVAARTAATKNMSDLLREADMQLYRAKQSGRNRVCAAA